ncbi:hypothetical protein [Burkholderia diffusa]|uniref:hypothetical protein n=1 Tax=Burkholderia diffusa TaxID=488732 RepID=UPI00157A3C57|nr:hypothetical protein [Burkholderia diffusa]NTY41247.1 hypothetical protein [Burkholderia diffusa]
MSIFPSLIDHALRDGAAAKRVAARCDRSGLNAANPFAARSEFSPERHAPAPGIYDEQLVLPDDSDRPLANVRYRVVTDTGQTFSGTTDSAGRMRRFATDTAASLKIYTKGF